MKRYLISLTILFFFACGTLETSLNAPGQPNPGGPTGSSEDISGNDSNDSDNEDLPTLPVGIGAPTCGNQTCETNENLTCPTDCPAPPGPGTACNNGSCESGETALNCPADCGSPGNRPDLRVVTSTSRAGHFTAGLTIAFTINYSNIGTGPATNAVVSATVPYGTVYSLSGSPTNIWSCAAGAPAFSLCTTNLGALNVGASGTLRFAVTTVGSSNLFQVSAITDDGANGPDLDSTNNGYSFVETRGYKSSYVGPNRNPNGLPNTANMLIPAVYNGSAEMPLLIILHGFESPSYAQTFNENFGGDFSAAVNTRNYFLLMPKGMGQNRPNRDYSAANPGPHWNATDTCCSSTATGGQLNPQTDVNDVAYLRGLIEEAQNRFRIDADRVYVTGFSNGAFMSYKLACEIPEMLAAIAPIAGATYENEALCAGTEPVSVLHIHGTQDRSVRYYDFDFDPDGNGPLPVIDDRADTPGAQRTIERWAAKAGCDTASALLPPINFVDATGNETLVHSYPNCDPGLETELWEIPGEGHGINYQSEAASLILDWLLRHQRP